MANSGVFARTGRDLIFVIDDRPEVRESTAVALESHDISHRVVGTLAEAEDVLRNEAERIAWAFIDKDLEEGHRAGLEFLVRQQHEYPHVRFALLTGWDLEDEERSLIEQEQVTTFDKGHFAFSEFEENLKEIRLGKAPSKTPDSFSTPQERNREESSSERATIREELFLRRQQHDLTQQRYERLRAAWLVQARSLLGLLAETSGVDDSSRRFYVAGKIWTPAQLVDEVERATPLGMQLLELHSLAVARLFSRSSRAPSSQGDKT